MFELGVNNDGQINVVQRDAINLKIKEMSQEILFEVFCDRYNETYVGDTYSTEYIDTTTVQKAMKSLSSISMQYMDSRTNRVITTTPDTVFKKWLTTSQFYLMTPINGLFAYRVIFRMHRQIKSSRKYS